MFDTELAAGLLRDMKILEQCYLGWRVVEPVCKQVIYSSIQDGKMDAEDKCFQYWQRGETCKNCISMRAYTAKDTFIKIEHKKDRLYIITAVPSELAGKSVVIELLQDATEKSIFESIFGQVLDITQMARAINGMNEALVKDALTQVYNRRFTNERLPSDLIAAQLSGEPIAVVLADIDHFKKVNDTYGHQIGDEVIKTFAALLTKGIRKTDWVARYGGEEFLIVLRGLRGAEREIVNRIVELIRKTVEDTPIRTTAGDVFITASFGTFTITDLVDTDVERIIAEADSNLYKAKQAGRNTVISS